MLTRRRHSLVRKDVENGPARRDALPPDSRGRRAAAAHARIAPGAESPQEIAAEHAEGFQPRRILRVQPVSHGQAHHVRLVEGRHVHERLRQEVSRHVLEPEGGWYRSLPTLYEPVDLYYGLLASIWRKLPGSVAEESVVDLPLDVRELDLGAEQVEPRLSICTVKNVLPVVA